MQRLAIAILEKKVARLTDMVPNERAHAESLDCPIFPDSAFIPPRPLSECRVALISSAGLMQRSGDNIPGDCAAYNQIDKACPDRDILINHISVNFDRTAFAADCNTVFPRALLTDLATDGTIAHASKTHYSFMGATAPEKLQSSALQLSAQLKEAGINTACLLPV